MFERQPLEGYIGCAHAISGTDFYTPTSSLRLPTIAIAGSEDGSTPPDLVRETCNLIPGSKFNLIKGVGQSNSNRLTIEITDEDDQVIVSLETPITSDGLFSLPWKIPGDISTGMYTIKISDAENSSSFEIFIQ